MTGEPMTEAVMAEAPKKGPTRLRLLNPPTKRILACFPDYLAPPANLPGIKRRKQSPTNVDFRSGVADIADRRLVDYLIRSGYCAQVPMP